MPSSLRAHLPDATPLATWSGLDAWWSETCRAAAARCPALAAPSEGLTREFARALKEVSVEGAERLAAADLLLAIAAAAGERQALEALETMLLTAARQALGTMGLAQAERDEGTQRTRELLTVGGRLASYSGRGPLDAWLRAVVTRQALNLRRERHQSVDGLSSGVAADLPGPESILGQAEHRAAFKAALAQALGALTARERTLLRLHGVDNLSLASIGAMYGRDASTVSRWLDTARQQVRRRVLEHLQRELKLNPESVDGLVDAATLTGESLARLLDTPA